MDPLNLIISTLIEKGGIWGVIASALFFWNIHKETSLSKRENKTQDSIKTIQESTEKKEKESKEASEKKERELREKIEELEKIINNQQETIHRLSRDFCDLERARVEDLKELLSEYHSTASATLQALEKFEFFITNSKRA